MTMQQLAELFAPYGGPSVILPEGPAATAAGATAVITTDDCVPTTQASQPPLHSSAASPAASPPATSPPLQRHHAFLAFEAEGDAAAAAAAVPRNAPWDAAGGRKLVVNYAELRRDKRPVPRPVATCTEGLGVPGLVLLRDFVSAEEEVALLAAVDAAAAAAAVKAAEVAEVTAEAAKVAEAEAPAAFGEEATSVSEGRELGQGACGQAAAACSGGAAGGHADRRDVDLACGAREGDGCRAVSGDGASCSGGGGGGDGGGGWETMARRRVQHYGYRFDYASRNVDPRSPLGPLPHWVAGVAQRIAALAEVAQPLDQLTVNEYQPGVGISPHVDTHSAFTGPIIVLSLGSHAVMELRRGELARPLLLPPRSLLVMGGESRYAWQHYIPHRVADVVDGTLLPRSRRVSLTFRQVRGFPCDCQYPESCDSQMGSLPPTRISQLREAGGSSSGGSSSGGSSGRQSPQPESTESAAPSASRAATEAGGGAGAAAAPYALNAPGASPPHPHHGADADIGCCSSNGPAMRSGRGSSSCGVASCGGAAGDRDGGATGEESVCQAGGGAGGRRGDATAGGEEARLAALEAEFVHKVYDAIAPHFSSTRFAIWPRVRSFIESLPTGGVVADVGCGNGKYFGVRRDLAVLGSDISAGLASVAAQRLHPPGLPPSAAPPAADALVADALRLPYRAACADGALCIAVLHHLSSETRRLRLLRQLLRVLRPGGRCIVTVWATEQEDPAKTLAKWTRIPAPAGDGGGSTGVGRSGDGGGDADGARVAPVEGNCSGVAGEGPRVDRGSGGGSSKCDGGGGGGGEDYFVPWHLPFHRTEAAKAARQAAAEAAAASGSGGGSGQASKESAAQGPAPKVDASKGAVVFQRYYHLFTRQELRALTEAALAAGPAAEPYGGDGADAEPAAAGPAGGDGDGAEAEEAEGLHGRQQEQPQGRGEPWGVVEEVFYDRSNWCVVFRRTR